jgi:hypothetical protein
MSNDRSFLDPRNEAVPIERPRAAKLAGLRGRKVGLLDISKPRGNIFLGRLEERLREEGAEVLRYRKPTFAKVAPVDLRHEIAVQCDAVVEALAD